MGMFNVIISAGSISDSTQYALWTVTNDSSRPTVLKKINIAWAAIPGGEVGDSQEELFPLILRSGHGSAGSGGTSATPVNLDRNSNSSSAAFTARIMDSTKPSGGTPVNVEILGYNNRVPEDKMIPDDYNVLFPAGTIWSIEMPENPSGTKTLYGSITVLEI